MRELLLEVSPGCGLTGTCCAVWVDRGVLELWRSGADTWQKSFVKDLKVPTAQKWEVLRVFITTGYFDH